MYKIYEWNIILHMSNKDCIKNATYNPTRSGRNIAKNVIYAHYDGVVRNGT